MGGLLLMLLGACSAPRPRPTPAGNGPPRVEIRYRNDIAGSFRLVELEVRLDDRRLLACPEREAWLDARSPIRIFRDPLASGRHTLHARLVLRGHGHGVFAYLRDYRFRLEDRRDFETPLRGTLEIEAISFERGGATTPIEDRPRLRFELHSTDTDLRSLPAAPRCPWASADSTRNWR